MPGALNLADLFTKEDKDVAHYEAIRDKMVMPRESFGLPSNSYSNNNTTSWGVLERRTSDRNYEKMTRLTKSESKSTATATTQSDIDVSHDMKSPATNCYEINEDSEMILDHKPVAAASE